MQLTHTTGLAIDGDHKELFHLYPVMNFKKKPDAYKTVHYDKVAMAWQYIFGAQFHFGYFTTPRMPLEEATTALNDALLDLGRPDKDSHILDVGCGIGSPAFYINEKFGCSVVGISTSRKGVDLANTMAQKKNLSDRVQFLVASGTDNQFPADRFDIVWLMESSHTMKDKHRLFEACFRVLKPGGQLLLGDLMSRSGFTLNSHFRCLCQWGGRHVIGLIKMRRAFGPGWSESFHFYTTVLHKTGYKNIVVKDVGEYVWPTFECWKRNAAVYEKEIRRFFTKRQLSDFLFSTELLDDWYRSGFMSYGLVCANKPG